MGWLESALEGTTEGTAKAAEANENAGVNFDWQEDSNRPIQIIRIDGSTTESTETPDKVTWEQVRDSYGGWEEDREDAAKIREEAIKNGTWKTKDSTEPTETVQAEESIVPVQPDIPANHLTSILVCSTGSFVLGLIIMFVFMKLHIKKLKAKHEEQVRKIKTECDIKISEARAALDRMLVIASQK